MTPKMAVTAHISRANLNHVLSALTYENQLVIRVAMSTGLRVGDVLSLKTSQLSTRFTVQEQKTGKNKRCSIGKELYQELLKQAGKVWVFPHRTDGKKHRTRQAVYKDIKRAAKLFRIDGNIAPHSVRKMYAVEQFHKTGDLNAVQRKLNHSSPTVTLIYAMADQLTKRGESGKLKRGGKNGRTS